VAAKPDTPEAPAEARPPVPRSASLLTPVDPASVGTLAKPGETPPPATLQPPPTAPANAPGAEGKLPVLPFDIGRARLRAAALASDALAAFEVGSRLAEGRSVRRDLKLAAEWFEHAARLGLAPAQYRIGSIYEKGIGLPRDAAVAKRWYEAAAAQGNAKAMHNLAVLYAEGIDGKPDYQTAAQWFRKAASRGVADSQYNLGILYARGIGVEQNLAESYKWFALAAQQGDQDAGRKRDDVAKRLDSQSLVAARLAAQTFAAEPQPEEATIVRPPAGGWDRERPTATVPAAKKPAPRRSGSS
jgi:localization factor PodJL